MLDGDLVFSDEDGNGYIKCKPKKEFEGNIARTYMVIVGGFELVAENYKKYINFKVAG
jgi:uncharacterized protein YsxB (DUF464 family)